MAKNLVEILQQAAGFDPLQKVDPNKQEIDHKNSNRKNLLGQAVIPAVLIGFYKYSRDEKNAENILNRNISSDWPRLIFANNKSDITRRIAEYASVISQEADVKIKAVAELAADTIRDHARNKTGEGVREYLTLQRNDILHYLPPALQVGDLINDNTLDDRTNKMEGPMSSAMHKIEQLFAGTDNPGEKELKR